MLTFTGLLVLAETDLASELSGEVSCTDASPAGGGCSVATEFKEKTLLLPDPVEDLNFCGACQKELAEIGDVVSACARSLALEITARAAQGSGGTCRHSVNASPGRPSRCRRRWA